MDKFIGIFFATLIVTTISFTGLFASEGKHMQQGIKLAVTGITIESSLNRMPAIERR